MPGGIFDIEKETIYLQLGMPTTKKMEILLHEVIHAIEYIYTLSLTEKEVQLIAVGILDFIRHNKIQFLEDV